MQAPMEPIKILNILIISKNLLCITVSPPHREANFAGFCQHGLVGPIPEPRMMSPGVCAHLSDFSSSV